MGELLGQHRDRRKRAEVGSKGRGNEIKIEPIGGADLPNSHNKQIGPRRGNIKAFVNILKVVQAKVEVSVLSLTRGSHIHAPLHLQLLQPSTMAIDIAEDRLRLPNPPPLLHTRSGNDSFGRPATPNEGFTSPPQTPHGSPSKSRPPPGALDLPNAFDKVMKLTPTSPTKNTHNHFNHPMFTDKTGLEDFNESVIHQRPSSPTRKANKENTPPSTRAPKDLLGPNPTAAALSRHEPYQQRDTDTSRRQVQLRGLTPEEMEKLQQPRVKRLVNVTQLCMSQKQIYKVKSYANEVRQTSSITTSTS